MMTAQVAIPQFDLSNRSTGIATLEGKATAEGTTQKAKTRDVQLVAKKVQVLVPTTLELLQDAPQLFGMDIVHGGLDATAGFVAGSVAADNTDAAHGGSKAKFHDLSFTHYYDKSSHVI